MTIIQKFKATIIVITLLLFTTAFYLIASKGNLELLVEVLKVFQMALSTILGGI